MEGKWRTMEVGLRLGERADDGGLPISAPGRGVGTGRRTVRTEHPAAEPPIQSGSCKSRHKKTGSMGSLGWTLVLLRVVGKPNPVPASAGSCYRKAVSLSGVFPSTPFRGKYRSTNSASKPVYLSSSAFSRWCESTALNICMAIQKSAVTHADVNAEKARTIIGE